MIRTTQASVDGIKVLSFFEGREYELIPQLQKALAGMYTVIVEGQKATAPSKNKATAPPENK